MSAKIARLFLIGLFVFLLASPFAGSLLVEAALHPPRRAISSADEARAREIASARHARLSEVAIQAIDRVTLRGWQMVPAHSNGKSVLLLHGVGDNRTGTLGVGDLLLSQGFTVLLPDARAHGSSGGSLATYGIRESADIQTWVSWIAQTNKPTCIYGFGESMGAAQLLESLRTETRFCSVAAESPFANFREVAYDRIGGFFHTGPWLGRTVLRPAIESAFLYAQWKYHLDFNKIAPETAVGFSHTPILLVHGMADRNIPLRHSLRIAARNRDIKLWQVPGADHCGAFAAAPEEFCLRVVRAFSAPRLSAATFPATYFLSQQSSIARARASEQNSSTSFE